MKNKITPKIEFDIETDGLPTGLAKGKHYIVAGVPNSGKSTFMWHDLEQAKKITEQGRCIIREMIDKLKAEGFDMSAFDVKTIQVKKK